MLNFSQSEWNDLTSSLLNWAQEAHSIDKHPLSKLSSRKGLSSGEFEDLVLMTGRYLMPYLYSELMKNEPILEPDLELICDSTEIRELDIFKALIKASITEVESPQWKTLQDILIIPLMDNLLIKPALKKSHPLHRALVIIATVSARKNKNEAANLEMLKEGNADDFHLNEIAGKMSRFTWRKVTSLKNSKKGQYSPPDDSLSLFISQLLKRDIKISKKEAMKEIEKYSTLCQLDEEDEVIGKVIVVPNGDHDLIKYEQSGVLSGELKSTSLDVRVYRERKKYKLAQAG